MNVDSYKKLDVGAGSNTFHLITDDGSQYILKNTNITEANNPQNEPALCNYLLSKGIPVSEFISDIQGKYLWNDNDDVYHMQKYVQGTNYDMHCAPNWLMRAMPKMLGKIHTALKEHEALPIGIGANFFKYMTPEAALQSYNSSYDYVLTNKYSDLADDLSYRIELMAHFSIPEIDLSKLTCGNTHGDYFISQLICNSSEISAVIDWTTACIHPLVWEIIRSFIYGSPKSRNGTIDIPGLVEYVKNYLSYAPLSKYDLKMMPYVFYYQISVCDYYSQYFQSTANNKHIYLEQAILSTKLMKWFEKHSAALSNALIEC